MPKAKQKSRRALTFITAAASLLVIAALAMTVLINPYRIMPWTDLAVGWNGPVISLSRVGLTRMAAERNPDLIVLGGSQTLYANTEGHFIEHGRTIGSVGLFFNSFGEHLDLLDWANSELDAETYVIEVKPIHFGYVNARKVRARQSEVLSPPDQGETVDSPKNDPAILLEWAQRYIFSASAMEHTLTSITRWREPPALRPGIGQLTARGVDYYAELRGHENEHDKRGFNRLMLSLLDEILTGGYEAPEGTEWVVSPERIERFAQATAFCDTPEVTCHFFVPPLRNDYLDVLEDSGLLDRYNSVKQHVADATGHVVHDFATRAIADAYADAFVDPLHLHPEESGFYIDEAVVPDGRDGHRQITPAGGSTD